MVYPNTDDLASMPHSDDCSVDYFNRVSLTLGEPQVDRFSNYGITGWVLDVANHDDGDPADLVVTEATSNKGWVLRRIPRTPRPDVVKARGGDSAYEQSGFMVLFPSDELKPGSYRISLVFGKRGSRKVCGGTVFKVTQ